MDRLLQLGLFVLRAYNQIKHGQAPLPVLYFHRVLTQPSAYHPDDWTIASFDELLAKLSKHFTLLPATKALLLQQQGQLPYNALVLSFDDGYADNFHHALPILDKYGVKANFFIATQGIEAGFLWNDKLEHAICNTRVDSLLFEQQRYSLATEQDKAQCYLQLVGKLKVLANAQRDQLLLELIEQIQQTQTVPPRCMMTKQQLAELQLQGHDIGAHTHSHSILAYQDDDTAQLEISQSVHLLNQILAQPITTFAYPNGWYGRDFDDRHRTMLAEHKGVYGFATNDGGIRTNTMTTALPRFMPHRKELNQFCIAIAKIAGE